MPLDSALGELRADDWQCDHTMPVSRGGSWKLSNVAVCCKGCNQAKGGLDGWEWMELLQLAATWPEAGWLDLFRRLKAGGGFRRGRKA